MDTTLHDREKEEEQCERNTAVVWVHDGKCEE